MNQLIADLIAVGLSTNQAKAYFFLLTNSELSASELAKVSRIPRTRIYNVLEVLVKKGLCVEKHDRIRHYRAIRPAEALGILDKELAAKRELLLKLTDTLDKLYLMENRQEDPLDFIEVVSDRKKQIARINFLDDLVRFELFAMCKAPFDRDFINEQAALLKKYSDQELNYRFLFEIKKKDLKKMKPFLKELSNSGAAVAVSGYLPFKMNIYDSSRISFYKIESAVDPEEPVLMIMKDNTLVKLFKSVFNKYFEEAEKF